MSRTKIEFPDYPYHLKAWSEVKNLVYMIRVLKAATESYFYSSETCKGELKDFIHQIEMLHYNTEEYVRKNS